MIRLDSLFLPVVLMSLSACASSKGFDRAEMQNVMRQTVPLSGPQTAAGVTEPAPGISAPFRLGLFFTQNELPTREGIRLVEWRSGDRDLLIRALAPLRDQHLLSDVIEIANPATQNPTPHEIRKAAARYGADMIVVITGVGAEDRFNNGYAALYPKILGAYLAPGTISDALFMVEGSLWDVRAGFAYGTQGAEGRSTRVGPAIMIEDLDTFVQAKTAALEEYGRKLSVSLTLIGPQAPQSPDRVR